MTKTSNGASQLNLVDSSRLQALRNKTTANRDATPSKRAGEQTNGLDAETARLRQQIQQQLSEILAQLPAGRQRSLFKIRFGITVDAIENLPPEQAAAILKIKRRKR